VGWVNGYLDRMDTLRFLGKRVLVDGGQRYKNLTPKDYARILQRSKISLNFSKTRVGISQLKGRPWEVTLCGAALFDSGTNLWFEPFKDYVPFNSNDDLVEKLDYYLDNPLELTEIANRGKNKSETLYSPKNWWARVLNRV
jgi:spore maturation protein CgeB